MTQRKARNYGNIRYFGNKDTFKLPLVGPLLFKRH